jgi:hypothetical protein
LVAAAVIIVVRQIDWNSCDIPDAAPPGVAGHGELRVVEQGFTQPVDQFGAVSIGALVENTTGLIAYRTRVTVRLKDAQNQVLTGFREATDEIPVVVPGQRVGIGMTLSPTGPETIGKKVGTVEIVTHTATWLPADALGEGFSPVTAEYRGTVRRDPKNPQMTEIRFVPQSDSCRWLSGYNPATVLRDSSGAIVGGMREYTYYTEACGSFGRDTWVVPLKALPVADDARTQLYPYCDIN